MLNIPFYNPQKTYEENYKFGPFGEFANPKICSNKNEPQLDFLGEKLFFDFGIPAGPLVNSKFIRAALDKGFDIVTYKTVRSKKYPCNSLPNILGLKIKGDLSLKMAEKGIVGENKYAEPLSITNSFGVPSFDPDIWQPDLKDAVQYAKNGQIVIGSFQGTLNSSGNIASYVADFVKLSRLVKETGVKVMEVNLSCPNEGVLDLLCFDIERVERIVLAIKNEIGRTPLVIKIAYFENQSQLEKLVKTVGKMVEAIEAINTIPAKIYDKFGKQALPGEARLKAGVCGKSIKWAGIKMTNSLKKLREELDFKYSIIGVGGVSSVNDYSDYKNAGADAVMSATGAMWNPYLAQEIKKYYDF